MGLSFRYSAERKGFEPPLPSRVNTFSRRAQSSTLPPLQVMKLYQLFDGPPKGDG